MVDEKLVKYVQDQMKAGFSEEIIKDQLLKAGHPPADVAAAFSEVTKPEPVNAPPSLEEELEKPSSGTSPAAAESKGTDFVSMLKNNWMILIVVAIVAAGGIFGAVFFLGGGGIGGPKSCAADQTCLSNAFSSCSKATGVYTTSSSGSALTFEGTVGGKSGKNCAFSVSVKSASGNFAEYRGKSMSCAVPLAQTASVGNPLSGLSKVKPHCSGTLTSLVD